MKILMVLTSHDQLGDTERATGFWLEELAAPYYLKDAGWDITLASPQGGRAPLDPKSDEPQFQTDLTRRFEAEAQLAATVRLDSVYSDDSTLSSTRAGTARSGISPRTPRRSS
jgi:hypothetical protein